MRSDAIRITLIRGDAMAEFEIGSDVSFVLSDQHPEDGTEVTGKLLGDVDSKTVSVEVPGDPAHHFVLRSGLLKPKGPFFDVRGQVMTTNASHHGEIVATGTGPKRDGQSGKRFFQIRFADEPKVEWFSEDQVFIADDDSITKSEMQR